MRQGISILDGAISSHAFNVIGLDFSLKQKIGKRPEKIALLTAAPKRWAGSRAWVVRPQRREG
ncbi:MAG: hypothetical protein V7609_51 [Verrucomicrobiota bacterium]